MGTSTTSDHKICDICGANIKPPTKEICTNCQQNVVNRVFPVPQQG